MRPTAPGAVRISHVPGICVVMSAVTSFALGGIFLRKEVTQRVFWESSIVGGPSLYQVVCVFTRMDVDLDELEEALLTCLREHSGLRYNELLREMESRDVRISKSGLSRRLKRLVRFGLLTKEVEPGWPPSTRYHIPTDSRLPLRSRILFWSRSNVIYIGLTVVLVCVTGLCLFQTSTIDILTGTVDNLTGTVDNLRLGLDSVRDLLLLASDGRIEVGKWSTVSGEESHLWSLTIKEDTRNVSSYLTGLPAPMLERMSGWTYTGLTIVFDEEEFPVVRDRVDRLLPSE